MQKPTLNKVLAPLVLGAVILLAWQLALSFELVRPTLLPPPAKVFQRLQDDLAAGILSSYAAVTLKEALLGCLVGVSIAIPLGILMEKNRLAEAAISPYLAASQAIPAIAIAPLLVLWVGYGMRAIVVLCALLVFFPVTIATTLGLRQIETDLIEAARLDGAYGWSLLTQIEAPLARRTVIVGLRNGFTLSITGAVIGEFVMGGQGLGMLLTVQANSSDTIGLFATLIVLAALAIAVYLVMIALETWLDPLKGN